MPTVIATHDVTDTAHWLSSPKREEVFGPIGVTNIRTFVNPQNRNSIGLTMDVPDMDAIMAMLESDEARPRKSTTWSSPRPSRSSSRSRRRGLADGHGPEEGRAPLLRGERRGRDSNPRTGRKPVNGFRVAVTSRRFACK